MTFGFGLLLAVMVALVAVLIAGIVTMMAGGTKEKAMLGNRLMVARVTLQGLAVALVAILLLARHG